MTCLNKNMIVTKTIRFAAILSVRSEEKTAREPAKGASMEREGFGVTTAGRSHTMALSALWLGFNPH
jgi:hypothetical protein